MSTVKDPAAFRGGRILTQTRQDGGSRVNAYDRLLDAMADMARDSYHLDRHAPSDYRGGDFTPYSTDEVSNRLQGPLFELLEDLRERLLWEAAYERGDGSQSSREQRSLTWSAAADLVLTFSENFQFTDSPELRHAVQWFRQNVRCVHTPSDRQEQLFTLGDTIREARRRTGISRKELAKRLQWTKETVRALEGGEIDALEGIRLDNRHPALRWIAYHLGILIWDVLVFRDGDVER